ncbi:ABC transporter substrate-binding protein [Streptomyces sp. MST-110588]|uniref:ABC transporter substrate-binding protein n=1 Tax=Streptomyces sp. MST-110588 TaxID=2833628 RepID=UPI001F5D9A6C|nr:ABC transporter substrate-binding protein [Streptomyces sp. MST-110588]UNO41815.1 ABC transporter substrate-binding protein [Streptomyces sp. MST-110588]
MSRRRTFIAAALLVPLTACGTPQSGDDGKAPTAKKAGFPYTVTNCGVRTTFKAPPERVVTMNQHVTEVMLALGLKDRLVGTAYLDDKVLPRFEKDYKSVKVLAAKYPSYETLLGANPDFVYGGYASAFDKQEGRDRADLEKAGIATRMNVEGCPGGKATGMARLRQEIRETGATFGVPERAEALIKEADAAIAGTEKALKGVRPLRTVVYDSGDTAAFTAGGKGIGNEIIGLAGGENVFADLDRTFGDVSWEQVVQRRPEVILIYDYGGTSVAAKKKRLLEDPALADVPAVKNKRFAVLPLSSVVLGVRVPDAVDALARQLHPEAFKKPVAGEKTAADAAETATAETARR